MSPNAVADQVGQLLAHAFAPVGLRRDVFILMNGGAFDADSDVFRRVPEARRLEAEAAVLAGAKWRLVGLFLDGNGHLLDLSRGCEQEVDLRGYFHPKVKEAFKNSPLFRIRIIGLSVYLGVDAG